MLDDKAFRGVRPLYQKLEFGVWHTFTSPYLTVIATLALVLFR